MCKKFLNRPQTISCVKPALENADLVLFNGTGHPDEVLEIRQILGDKNLKNSNETTKVLAIKPTLNNALSSSTLPHFPHCDGVYIEDKPTHVLLQVEKPDLMGGGQGLYWDMRNFNDSLPGDIKDTLLNFPIKYQRRKDNGDGFDRYNGTILSKTDKDSRYAIRWRLDMMVWPELAFQANKKEKEQFQRALNHFLNYFAVEEPAFEVPYKKGQIAIVSNEFAIHGRRKILDPERKLTRVWMNLN